MSNWRIKYGSAFGPEGSAGLNSANNLITPGDTTPDVSNGTFFLTANTSATTISYFDLVGKGGVDAISQNNGKVIHILFQDNLTTLQATAGAMFLENAQGPQPANSTMDLIFYNSAWVQRAGGVAPRFQRLNVSQAGSVTINVTSANYVVITPTAASLGVLGFGGVVSNQTIKVLFVVTTGIAASFAQSAGNLSLAGTNGLVASGSGFYDFTTLNGSQWFSTSSLVSP